MREAALLFLYLLVLLVVGVVITLGVIALARWIANTVIMPYSDPEATSVEMLFEEGGQAGQRWDVHTLTVELTIYERL